MRSIISLQRTLGSIAIEDINLDPNSRDDIPAILYGIQHLYKTESLRERVFSVLERELFQEQNPKPEERQTNFRKKLDPNNGRPGMDLWKVLVLALLKQGLGYGFDRLAELASKHVDIQNMLGNSGLCMQPVRYAVRTVSRNVQLLTPELLQEVNLLVVGEGQRLAGWEPGEELQARCDSYVVETNVEYPTDHRITVPDIGRSGTFASWSDYTAKAVGFIQGPVAGFTDRGGPGPGRFCRRMPGPRTHGPGTCPHPSQSAPELSFGTSVSRALAPPAARIRTSIVSPCPELWGWGCRATGALALARAGEGMSVVLCDALWRFVLTVPMLNEDAF